MVLSEIPYMRWAKFHAYDGEFNLTQSAVGPLDWEELGLDPRQVELFHYSRYGDLGLLEDIASRWSMTAEQVFLASSTTHTHFCFAAAILEPGDRVLHERPGYFPLVDSLSVLKVDPVPFDRRFESGYSLPHEQLRAGVDAGAKLILLTHLHNPTGVGLSDEDQTFLVDLCETTGVVVLSDEIYRPFLDPDPGPLHRKHPNIVSVMGLNKVHGLPQIRIGWGFAGVELIERARRVLDATTVHNSCLSDQVAMYAVPQMVRLERRAHRIAQAGWDVLRPWLERSSFEWVAPAGGLVCFPRVGDPEFAARCLEKGVNMTPGRYFGAADHVRLGFGTDPAELTLALERLDVDLG